MTAVFLVLRKKQAKYWVQDLEVFWVFLKYVIVIYYSAIYF